MHLGVSELRQNPAAPYLGGLAAALFALAPVAPGRLRRKGAWLKLGER